MAEINDDNGIKIIPFYLPQFHSIPENDLWWGKDFTEWTNVKKAQALFSGHDQPKVPLNANYYNLLRDETKIWQADLAKQYGIFGFCYYHYWFKNGKKLLETPAEQMLINKSIDFPFCFCWANENWSRNWDGGNNEIIMEQDYGTEEDWEKHFAYLLPFFKDERYITVDGKPLLVIYKPEQIIYLQQMIAYFRKLSMQAGFPGLCCAFQFPTYYDDMYYQHDIFDFFIEFEPIFCRSVKRIDRPDGESSKIKLLRSFLSENVISMYRQYRQKKTYDTVKGRAKLLAVYFYDEAWQNILETPITDKLIPGGFVDWDNTPRNKHGVMYSGFTLEKFEKYMTQLLRKTQAAGKQVVFLNAWNEWGEGAFLEPDEKYGLGKLEAIRRALETVR